MALYKLLENVYYVSGALRGALCDVLTGNVYSIDESACRIIERKESNEEFWEELVKHGLAEISDNLEPPKLPEPTEIKLKFMWLEIVSDDCNLHCMHCYAGSMPPVTRKSLFKQHDSQVIPLQLSDTSRPHLRFKDWIQMLKEGYELGCRRVQFIGGEPFLYHGETQETVLDLAAAARAAGYSYVEIFTNGTLLTQDKVDRIRDLNLRIAISLYSSNPEVHDQITGIPGSHVKTMHALDMLNEANVKTRIATTLMRLNEIDLPESLPNNYHNIVLQEPDPIRPVGRGKGGGLQPSLEQEIRYGYLLEPDFVADPKSFLRNLSGNNCLAGKITINEYGVVTPCIFSRFQAAANIIHTGSLKKAIDSSIMQTIWHQTKDKIMVCKDCEYRYVCTDCRPLAEAAGGANAEYLTAPYPRCTYNPYTGKWAKGAWRLSDDNEPYYDTSLEPLIQRVLQSGEV